MIPQRLALKFPVAGGFAPEGLDRFIGLFHGFIQKGAVEGLLIDVADYAHVPDGPGVLLIGHDVDYALDLRAGRPGLLTTRKRHAAADLAELLRDTLRRALVALRAIERDGSTGVRFATDAFELLVLDRLAAPNTRESYAALCRDVEPVLRDLLGEDVALEPGGDDAREPLGLRVALADPLDADAVIEKLGGARVTPQLDWDIDPEELKPLLDRGEVRLLDVREPAEAEASSLGGELFPLGTLGSRLDELDREQPLVVHCRSGERGARAAILLREAGFAHARNLRGGLLAWIERVDPSLPRG